ncbi:hypothetical protein BCR42DRAFT_176592 [Absidia repens]|uniref:Uncharacterized protein n=1 Tax=Absidia repens TaxID=90262 RepID=A0A1X2HZ02_9FUNG|nr:hypothetical protein BCR42DRAFT_176592 [Absidia repens]
MSTTQKRRAHNKETEHVEEPSATRETTSQQQTKPNQNQITFGKVLKNAVIVLAWGLTFFFLGSYLLTESWTWGYRGKWTNLHTYIPVSIYIKKRKTRTHYTNISILT